MENNLDEDIKRCKELIKTEHANWIGLTNQEAISNVLRELERYKQYYEEQNEVNKKFVSKDKFDEVNLELETYKKIAYFLGARYWLKDCEYDLDKFNSLDEIIDWAKSEVLDNE